ncbi:MAG: hypothetical protein KBO60_27880, partial [Achromobacter sp.]|nr:hypothetical protein [Achromobacter sp.]
MTPSRLRRTPERIPAHRSVLGLALSLALAACASPQGDDRRRGELSIDQVPPLASSLAPSAQPRRVAQADGAAGQPLPQNAAGAPRP